MSSFTCLGYGPYVAADVASSAGHSHCVLVLPPHVSIVLPHFISFIEQVCPAVRPHLSDADKERGEGWPLSLGTKKLPHCIACVLLPCSCLHHNVIHSPIFFITGKQYVIMR